MGRTTPQSGWQTFILFRMPRIQISVLRSAILEDAFFIILSIYRKIRRKFLKRLSDCYFHVIRIRYAPVIVMYYVLLLRYLKSYSTAGKYNLCPTVTTNQADWNSNASDLYLKFPHSNLVQNTDSPYPDSSQFYSVPPENFWDGTLN
jgi:hypothetical protein